MTKQTLTLFLVLILYTATAGAYQPAVVSAHPDASKVGLDILKKGGSAADAAIATAFALSVVEPYNSGMGGGGFLLYYEAKTKKFYFVDYREIAPQKADSLIYRKDKNRLWSGIHSVAVPGFLLGMETIHKKWRRISWPAVVEPSIELAKKGIPLTGKLREEVEKQQAVLGADPAVKNNYLESYKKRELKVDQSDLAATLENIKTGGAEVFYRGELAEKVVSFVKEKGGLITLEDLKGYRVYFRDPHQFEYRNYKITSAPLPSSGGIGLDLLFRKSIVNNLEGQAPYSPRAFAILLECLKEYFEYRNVALADTPVNVLSQTTHISAIDKEGNMAAMTNTLNQPFGSGLIVPETGIVLNNEMADFSISRGTANRIRPGMRPLSSMAPTIVFKDDQPKLIIGTPGGITIPQNIYQILFFWIKWETPIGKAISQSKIYYSPYTKDVVVENKVSKKIVEELEKSHRVRTKPSIGNVQALFILSEKRTNPYPDHRGEGKGDRLQ